MNLLRVAVPIALAAVFATVVSSERAQRVGPGGSRVGGVAVAAGTEDSEAGLRFRLSEGEAESKAVQIRPAAATPLGDSETQALLDRLPPIKDDSTDSRAFAFRDRSLPPPRPGKTVAIAFPPPAERIAPPTAAPGPLRVERRSPEGPVPLAPHLNITFSQPMVAIASQDAAATTVPVRLTPQPDGQWRWVGAQTVLFEPKLRFAMATDYTVEVPQGTRSSVGGSLAAAERWSFSTPPATVVGKHPLAGPSRRDAVVFVSFDQRIEPQAVLPTLKLVAEKTPVAVRLATADEVEKDAAVRQLARSSEAGRWLAIRSVEPLPPDTEVHVRVGPGTPSAEGPRKTDAAQEWTFRTYGPLRIREHRCGWGPSCQPLQPWSIWFTNPLDSESFDAAQMISVTPPLASLKADVSGDSLRIRGLSKGRTTYRVTLKAGLADSFGQTLGRDEPLVFTVGSAEANLFAPGGNFVVLDPAAPQRFSVYTVNQPRLKVRAYRVAAEDFEAFTRYLIERQRTDQPGDPPGQRVLDTTVSVQGTADELTETAVDLRPAFTNGLGHVVLLVEPSEQPKERWQRRQVIAWVQSTRLGLDAAIDGQQVVAWTTALADGQPTAGVELRLLPGGAVATSDAGGLARLTLSQTPSRVLVARTGRDVAILPENTYAGSPGWRHVPATSALRWFVFDDRHLYKPGEEVKLKGWVRRGGGGPQGDLDALGTSLSRVAYALSDSRGNEIEKGDAVVNAFGGFDLGLKLPPNMNLGSANVAFEASVPGVQATQWGHTFDVQEFRRPEFEVTAEAGEGPHFVGRSTAVAVNASYFAGGALPGADVSWRVTASEGEFRPPNRDDFSFGRWRPWWHWDVHIAPRVSTPQRVESFAGRTDGNGRHVLRVDFDDVRPPAPSNVEAEATVMDVNRQAWTARSNLLVHPADVYVGLKSERVFVEAGKTLEIDWLAVDLDGRAAPDRPVTLRVERIEHVQRGPEWRETAEDVQEKSVRSAAEAQRASFTVKEGGQYRVAASVTDTSQRRNESELRLWVAGGKTVARRDLELEAVTLVPSRKEYRKGDTAEVLVVAPFAPAEGLLTLRRSGLLRTERFRMASGSHTLRLPIEEAWTPNVHVQVELLGSAARVNDDGKPATGLPRRPAYASGTIDLAIPPRERTLALELKPRESALEPGGKTVVDLTLRDAAQKPVGGGEVAVVVVDEAVLSLSGYRIPDPLDAFYPKRGADVRDHRLRQSVLLGRPEDLAVPGKELEEQLDSVGVVRGGVMAQMALPASAPAVPERSGRMAKSVAEQVAPQPIRARVDFSALALFAASVETDASGRASVPVTVPDNLTRYRVMAVAVHGPKQFGRGEATLTARLPLMVRPSAPRFLNFGDRFELPVVVQNQTDAALRVDVAVRATNATLTAGSGRRITVAANDRVEVRFPVSAERPGTARFQAGAASGRWADAAEVALPVSSPATTEAFATYGQIDQGSIAQPVQAPPDIVTEFGGLEVTTSSTALQALTDAVLYLAAYPFECAEQLSSRVLAVAALRDVLAAFRAEGLPPAAEIEKAVARDVERLRVLQNDDGGFAFWRRGDPSWPYISIHVAHALERARSKGFEVPAQVLQRSQDYLKNVEQRIPRTYGDDTRRMLIAYALYVRQRLGDADPSRARRLLQEAGPDRLSLEAVGWILPTLAADQGSGAQAAELRRLLANRVTESAATAHFAVSYGDGAHLVLHSDRRADAILLEALIATDARNGVIPKLVEGLLGHRTAGRWTNTQENAFVLLALDRYFRAYEKVTPDFVARAWLGERFAGEAGFHGRTTERQHLAIPMSILAAGGAPRQDLLLAKDGPGRLYYRIGMRYAPRSLKLDPADRGFTVERKYEAVDDPQDVRHDADGTWRVKAGTRIRVRLTLASSERRYHVALVDPLPAGLEAQNPALKTTGALPLESTDVTVVGAPGLGGPRRPGAWRWWNRPWFEHQMLRDDRAEAFTSLLWEGVYTYTYIARATTPGTFVVPPARAEEMYHPETFGRGGTDRLIVE